MRLTESRKSLSETAYEWLRDAIVNFRLEPGQMIYENEIAQGIGMSRTPMREAFRLLQTEGLIEVLPQRGGRVAPISEDRVEEARFVRESLELSACRAICRSGGMRSDSVRRKAQLLIDEQRERSAANDAAGFLRSDEAFHLLILEQWHNRMLTAVVAQMRGHLNRVRLLMLKELDQMSGLIGEHEALLEALAGGDESAVVKLLESHLGKLHEELPRIRAQMPRYFQPN